MWRGEGKHEDGPEKGEDGLQVKGKHCLQDSSCIKMVFKTYFQEDRHEQTQADHELFLQAFESEFSVFV